MIGKIEVVNQKTDVNGKAYETVLVNGEWLMNQEESLQGKLKQGVEYDLAVEVSAQLRPDGNPWPTKIKGITPVIDQSQPEPTPEPEEPSLDDGANPISKDEIIVRQTAYKVAGETVKAIYGDKTVSKEIATETIQDLAHIIAFDILSGQKWG